jgi:undecaprenyl-diphosphatase
VSSSAQLTLLPWLLRWPVPADRTGFAAGLHAGSTVGIALALREDVRALTPSDVRRLLATSVPAAVVGALAHGPVERRLGRPGPTAALLALSGVALWLADARPAALRDHGRTGPPLGGPGLPGSPLETGDLVAAALAQPAALAPGVSRTGATLTALRARGVDRETAARASLLMSLPVTAGAAALTAVRARQAPAPLPSALACVSAYVAARRLRPTRAWVGASVLYRLGVAGAVAARLRKERP